MTHTVTFQGHDYIVTHQFTPDHIWAYRELHSGLIEVYRSIRGSISVDVVAVSLLMQIFAVREQILQAQDQSGESGSV